MDRMKPRRAAAAVAAAVALFVSCFAACSGNPLSGMVERPRIALKQGGVDIASGGDFSFGPVLLGGRSEAVFVIENTGTATLGLLGVERVALTGSSAFSLAAAPPSSVAPGGEARFTLVFSPMELGDAAATVVIANDDPRSKALSFELSGNGFWSGSIPSIGVKRGTAELSSGGTVDLGRSRVGESLSVGFEIRNGGTAELHLNGAPLVSLSGADAGLFSVIALPAAEVPAGGSVAFTLGFASESPLHATATVIIASDDMAMPAYSFTVTADAVQEGQAIISLFLPGDGLVSFDGQLATIAYGQSMTVIASASPQPSSYGWYLDGSPLEGGAGSVTIVTGDGAVQPGLHTLALVLGVGDDLYSDHLHFEVVTTGLLP
jgi:hypothetical protein